jgi:Kef-type K+ transport system membrane component KefB
MGTALTSLALTGLAVIVGLYAGKLARLAGLPSVIGYLLAGACAGESILGLFSGHLVDSMGFVTNLALGFVAFGIGLELSTRILRKLGRSIVLIILSESFGAFIVVFLAVLAVTGGDLALAIVFGALAPASAPAGTVAVIQDTRAKGKLTQALYAVVGFDDGLAILIYGFAAAAAKSLISSESSAGLLHDIGVPAWEIFAGIVLGLLAGTAYTVLVKRLRSGTDIPALTFGFVALVCGIAVQYHLSLILANMTLGFLVANTSRRVLVNKISNQNRALMPLLFILFFFLAGAHLDLNALPSLGLLGGVYVLGRIAGKMGGAYLGATVGRAEDRIRRYLGLGILSQAGVAIGLSLVAANDFERIGTPEALKISSIVVTTIAATCIVFEVLGPIMAKIALRKAGETRED